MCAVLCQTAVWPGSDPTVRSAVNVRTALSATAGTDAAGVWTAGSASRAHNVNLLEIINPLASELTFIIAYESEMENHNLMQLCIFLYFIVVISRYFLVLSFYFYILCTFSFSFLCDYFQVYLYI